MDGNQQSPSVYDLESSIEELQLENKDLKRRLAIVEEKLEDLMRAELERQMKEVVP